MEAELLSLFLLHTLGVAVFGRFESETPWWRLTMKWLVLLIITYLLYSNFGHAAALGFIGFLLISGLVFHFAWCYKHDIHPVKAIPRKKYYTLRKWKWIE